MAGSVVLLPVVGTLWALTNPGPVQLACPARFHGNVVRIVGSNQTAIGYQYQAVPVRGVCPASEFVSRFEPVQDL